jgi:hypothetical protein
MNDIVDGDPNPRLPCRCGHQLKDHGKENSDIYEWADDPVYAFPRLVCHACPNECIDEDVYVTASCPFFEMTNLEYLEHLSHDKI